MIAPPPSQTMQRVKVGMIGLAAVVLLIGLASAIFSAASRERPPGAYAAAQAGVVSNMAMTNVMVTGDTGNEPLAELGVAPSTADANETAAMSGAPR